MIFKRRPARAVRERTWSDTGRVKYASLSDEERVVERRPVVEEVVVRRRLVDEGDSAANAEPARRASSIKSQRG